MGKSLSKFVLRSMIFCSAIFLGSTLGHNKALAADEKAETPCKNALIELNERDINEEWILDRLDQLSQDSGAQQRLRDAVRTQGVRAISLNSELLRQHNKKYTKEIKRGVVTDQKQSGRCWIFAGCTMEKDRLIMSEKVEADFEFSYTYLHFFNMLEKTNRYLVKTIETLTKKDKEQNLDADELRRELSVSNAFGDGGWYEYFQFLVAKYGIVPKEVMPETVSSENTASLLTDLKQYTGQAVAKMVAIYRLAESEKREITSEEQQSLWKFRREAMDDVFKVLVAHLGTPPSSFEYRKDKEVHKGDKRQPQTKEAQITKFTPREFADKFVGFKADSYVVLTATPLLPENQYTMVKDSSIGTTTTPAFDLKFLNLPIERLEQLIQLSVSMSQPLWFAADVSKDMDPKTGILHPGLFDRKSVYGTDRNPDSSLTPEQRVYLEISQPTHAMVITGYDRPDTSKPAIKYKVENSWGEVSGDKGMLHMYREWLEKNLYVIIVPKSILSDAERARLDTQPVVIKKDNFF